MALEHLLFIGLGGAGQRHLRIFRSLLPAHVRFSAYRARAQTPLLAPDFTVIHGRTIEAEYGLVLFDTLAAALDARPDMVVIANPTAHHLQTACDVARRGTHIFMEKPLGTDAQQALELLRLCRQSGSTCYVAYQRRFHPCVQRAAEVVRQGRLGRIVQASFETASFVPAWHPYEDYRQLYAVRADLGGGVLLTESHEFDIAYYLFGMPSWVACAGGTLVEPSLDVEDTASVLLAYGAQQTLPVQLSLSLMRQQTARSWSIGGTAGHLIWDERDNTLWHHDYQQHSRTSFTPEPFDRDTMFVAQARHYLAWLEGTPDPGQSVLEGLASLNIILAARRALASGQTEAVPPLPTGSP